MGVGDSRKDQADRPVLALCPQVQVRPLGLRRGAVQVPVTDALLVAGLVAGLEPRQVAQLLAGAEGPVLQALHRAGMLLWRLEGVAQAEVLGFGEELGIPRPRPGMIALSRFAVVHREGPGWVLDSGLSRWRVRLTPDGLGKLSGIDPDGGFAGLLELAGMLDARDDQAGDWSLHDRLFISRTRGSLPFLSTPARSRGVPAEPALRPSEPGLPLPAPDGPEIDEPSLWQATQARRSVRAYAERPVTLTALGHLLWRTLRVTDVKAADPGDPSSYETVWRPVPSGGGMHATDLWLFCRDVQGVEAGAYRYDPVAHALVHVNDAVLGANWPAPVVGVITARHKRTAWKYEPIALSLELKDVGVQMMALQLSAPAMGLGMCPVGTGSTTEVAGMLGIDPFVDAPVGEFLLGPL